MNLEYQIIILIITGIGGWVAKSNVKLKSSCFRCFQFEFETTKDEQTDKNLKSIKITQPTFNLKKSKSRAKVNPKDLSSSSESNIGSL
tara:strand:- start:4968 stop:5231 length:264 start_codon:yes stop_codon:yes gene_type:complete